MRLDAKKRIRYRLRMKTALTPEIVRQRATKAHVSINQLMKRARLQNSTFWRWQQGSEPHPVTLQKLSDALDAIEAEKAQAA
jgi:hypothetical protein